MLSGLPQGFRSACSIQALTLRKALLSDLGRRTALSAVYSVHGEPREVLGLHEVDLPQPAADEVVVDWLAAPINPADLNQVQGKYPLKPTLPAVPGNEGVGTVTGTGKHVTSLKAGDRVVPSSPCLGTWRERGVHPASALLPVSAALPIPAAATISINPPTALRLLEDVVELHEGDVIAQNAANSIVGQLVVQIAARRGIKTVNIVRDRSTSEGTQEVVDELKGLGADVVTTVARFKGDIKASGLPKAKLALNSVGGYSSSAIASFLGKKGTMVTYGGLSKQYVSVPASAFIFSDITTRGFWLSGNRTPTKLESDIERATKLWLEDGIVIGFDYEDLEAFPRALESKSSQVLALKKILLTQNGRRALADEQSQSQTNSAKR